MRVLITGGRGGLGRAFAEALPEAEITALDLADGFDVGNASAWHGLDGEFDAAFLNAGIVTGEGDIASLNDEQYIRAMRANVDAATKGITGHPKGGSIVATASLAGLTATPMDPIYSLTKHAVIGFVRSVAPQLAERGIRINALCPGFTDTPIVASEVREFIDVALIEPSFVADAALQALNDEETGRAWVVQPNRIVPFRFPNIPGPR